MKNKQEVNKELKKTIICFHIVAILYLILAVIFLIGGEGFFFVLGVVLALLIEFTITNLKERKFWSWVVALIISGHLVLSFFFIFGIISLIGLLNKNTRKVFTK